MNQCQYRTHLIYKGRLVCLSVCVIRMDGQTACLILTKIWEWIAIYPRGNIGGSLLTQQSSKGSSTCELDLQNSTDGTVFSSLT